jgi:hypothetical protein
MLQKFNIQEALSGIDATHQSITLLTRLMVFNATFNNISVIRARPCPSDALPFFSICSSALPFVTNVDVFFHTCY